MYAAHSGSKRACAWRLVTLVTGSPVMKHERPAAMGSVIVFQAHTRNGMCGRLRY